MTDTKRLERIETTMRGMLWQQRQLRDRVKQLEQAILELDAAFRRSGTLANGDLALSRSPSVENPGRPSADATRNLPA